MKTLYMMKGLPGCGKSTRALEMVHAEKGWNMVRVNKDDIRRMLGRPWNAGTETMVLGIRDWIVETGLKNGLHVIVDDTNFAPRHEQRLRQIAKGFQAAFVVVDMSDVPLEVCIAQDLNRLHSVGKDVIMGMWEKYLKPKPQSPPAWDLALESCIIVDIDGTVAQMEGRGPYDWAKVGEDLPRSVVMGAVKGMRDRMNAEVVFVSGRDGMCRGQTMDWLGKWGFFGAPLFMRKPGDGRRDSIVKREIYESKIKGKWNVLAIFDDRPQVIRECWQELGFGNRIFNVGDGREF